MRSFPDRVRHTLLFEAIALTLVAVAGGWILDRPIEAVGALGLMFSALAMAWNMLFNWLFDLWDRKYRGGRTGRGFWLRVAHAVLFELGMVIAGIFLVSWWLDVSYWTAFVIGIGFSAFFLVYAFCFNLAYDTVFPPPRTQVAQDAQVAQVTEAA